MKKIKNNKRLMNALSDVLFLMPIFIIFIFIVKGLIDVITIHSYKFIDYCLLFIKGTIGSFVFFYIFQFFSKKDKNKNN
ncbi:hypothetical protein MOO46_05510 [Apilactobacillus apisilvae]|uniref:Uncharacterized protein n=1 Tax=Apilactobacillus apisilvae TaxID=2923364 RepID=A0ABY4PGL3_9LACO|nr:hypothetical protein [Apilactobacillus apisilvae]UQS84705.1 hypothetical protein MOO46_05510 [Apilactobacillus apisilvae]